MKKKTNSRYLVIIIYAIIFALLVSSCKPMVKPPTREYAMERISSWSYPDFLDDMTYDGLEDSILQSLSYLNKIPADRQFIFGEDQYNTEHMIKSLQHFLDYIQTRPPRQEPERIYSIRLSNLSFGRTQWQGRGLIYRIL